MKGEISMKEKKKRNRSRSFSQNLVLLGLLALLVVFFAIQSDKFLQLYNILLIFRQYLPHFILSCAMMFVIASGAIDLSVGGVMALSAVFYGYLCIWGVNAWLAIPIVVLLGMAVGVINTIIMEKLHIPAIMATLATWLCTAGLALTICKAIPISDDLVKPITALNRLKFINNQVPFAFFVVVIVILVFLFLEKRTILGKYAIAMGGNENAAYYSGINIVKMRLTFFMLCGAMASLAGIWQVGRLGTADPKIGMNMEFQVIAACILGGVSIKGGEGSILGVVIGTSILALLTNGMQMMDIQSFYQQVVIGVVLLIAVLINYAVDNMKKPRLKRA